MSEYNVTVSYTSDDDELLWNIKSTFDLVTMNSENFLKLDHLENDVEKKKRFYEILYSHFPESQQLIEGFDWFDDNLLSLEFGWTRGGKESLNFVVRDGRELAKELRQLFKLFDVKAKVRTEYI